MVERNPRRLPTWLAVVDEDEKRKKKKKLPRVSRSIAGNGTEKGDDKLPPRLRGGNKRKANNAVFGTYDHIDANDDDALTVEDLVTIAQEYVKDNKDSEQNLGLSRIREPSSSNNLEGSNEHRLPSGETLNLTGEQSLSNFSWTGDPAQDMLHLFLGPLLNKPQEDEKRTQFGSVDMDLTHELEKQAQNDFREDIIPVTKKKSSLKDKVSLLLNSI